jgi:hypothetical protein
MSALGSPLGPGNRDSGASPADASAASASDQPAGGDYTGRPAWIAATIALITAIIGSLAIVGDDARWLAALGHIVVRDHAVPAGVPFAAASTAHWPNALVLAELVFYGLERAMGDQGLLVAQTLAAGVALTILAWGAPPRGAGPPRKSPGICQSLLIVVLGALTSFTVARVQMFSLVLFPLLLVLLRADQSAPSRRIWLVLPLLALWANLHGAVLAGLAVLYLYLSFSLIREKPARAAGLALVSLIATCATPAGVRTVDYYYGLTTNLAAQRGVGLWAPLGTGPFDLILIVAAIWLAGRAWRAARPPLWELVAVLILAALTIKAARNGVWLLFLLAAPAAQAARGRRDWAALIPVAAVAAIALLVADVVRWSAADGSAPAAITRAVQLARGSPILADSQPAEEIALAGGRIWAGNPIDAFSTAVQGTYLDFIAGSPGGRAALRLARIEVVVANTGTGPQQLVSHDHAFRRAEVLGNTDIYVRRR